MLFAKKKHKSPSALAFLTNCSNFEKNMLEFGLDMAKCRRCGCEELCKDGVAKGKQRYKCKQCKGTNRENDKRHK